MLGLRFIVSNIVSVAPGWVAGARATRELLVGRLITPQEVQMKKAKLEEHKWEQEQLSENEKLEHEKLVKLTSGV